MEGFAVYGYGSVAGSLALGVLVFLAARKRMALPWFLNLPGALIATVGFFLLAGWVFTVTGVMAATMPLDFQGVPWTSPAGVIMFAVCWYQAVWLGLKWTKRSV